MKSGEWGGENDTAEDAEGLGRSAERREEAPPPKSGGAFSEGGEAKETDAPEEGPAAGSGRAFGTPSAGGDASADPGTERNGICDDDGPGVACV